MTVYPSKSYHPDSGSVFTWFYTLGNDCKHLPNTGISSYSLKKIRLISSCDHEPFKIPSADNRKVTLLYLHVSNNNYYTAHWGGNCKPPSLNDLILIQKGLPHQQIDQLFSSGNHMTIVSVSVTIKCVSHNRNCSCFWHISAIAQWSTSQGFMNTSGRFGGSLNSICRILHVVDWVWCNIRRAARRLLSSL